MQSDTGQPHRSDGPWDYEKAYAASSGARAYYGEVLDAIPFAMSIELMKRMLPTPLAYAITIYYRTRHFLRLPSKPKTAFGPPGSAIQLPPEKMPARAMSRWAGQMETLRDLGFRPLGYSVGDVIGAKQSAAALYLDEPGSTFAVLEWQRMDAGAGEVAENTPIEMDSYLASDQEVMTGLIAEEHLILADAIRIDFIDQHLMADDVSIERCYQVHRERIEGRDPLHFTIENARSEHELHTQRRFDYLVDHLKLIKRLNDKEVAYARQHTLPS